MNIDELNAIIDQAKQRDMKAFERLLKLALHGNGDNPFIVRRVRAILLAMGCRVTD